MSGKLIVAPNAEPKIPERVGNALRLRLIRPRVRDEDVRHTQPLPAWISGL
jgi:hypothetical protein